LEEEIGYRAGNLTLLSSIFTAPGFTDEVIHIYRATELSRGRQNLDRDEVLEVVEVSLQEAIEMMPAGKIRDAKTMVGLQSVFISRGAR
jgi:ADP-ribose pyrophosphatase